MNSTSSAELNVECDQITRELTKERERRQIKLDLLKKQHKEVQKSIM